MAAAAVRGGPRFFGDVRGSRELEGVRGAMREVHFERLMRQRAEAAQEVNTSLAVLASGSIP